MRMSRQKCCSPVGWGSAPLQELCLLPLESWRSSPRGGYAGERGERRCPSAWGDGLGKVCLIGLFHLLPQHFRLLPVCPASGAGAEPGECTDGFADSQSDGENLLWVFQCFCILNCLQKPSPLYAGSYKVSLGHL